MKRFYIGLLILLCCSISAPATAQKRLVDKLTIPVILKKLFKDKPENQYFARSPYPFCIKARYSTTLSIIGMEWKENESSYSIISEPIFKIGAHFSYRGLGLGFQKDIKKFTGGNAKDNTEFNASAHGRIVGGDFSYRTQKNYSINKYNDNELKKELGGMNSKNIYANGYYVFNNKKFSYPAAITQSYRQKKSCGSVIAGLSFYYNKFNFNPEEFPSDTKGTEQYIKYLFGYSLNINAGYAYNWVINEQWMLHGSLLPYIPIIKSAKYETDDTSIKLKRGFGIGCNGRIGVQWNYEHHSANFTALVYLNNLSNKPLGFTDFYNRIQISYGYRF